MAKELGLNRFVSEQPPYHILDRRIERGADPDGPNIRHWTDSLESVAGGLLTGKYTREAPSPEGARYANAENEPRLARRKNDGIYDIVEGLLPLATAKDCTLSQFALAWCVRQPGITSPIIGPRTMEQLETISARSM